MNYREMSRLASDPVAVRATASMIRRLAGSQLDEWALGFLAGLEEFDGPEPLSMRQREALHSLKELASRREIQSGFRASSLVAALWELRFELSLDDEEFVEKLRSRGAELALSRNQWRRVFALCHETGLIEPYVAID